MHRHPLAALICVLFATQARAAAPPHFKVGLAYPAVVAGLKKAGFAPARIVSEGLTCGPGASPCRSPVIDCTNDVGYCERLFIRRSDETFFIVATHVGADLSGSEDTFLDIAPATRRHLQNYDLVVMTPNGKRRSFPLPLLDDKGTKLCSEPHNGTTCWVKPPPGFRPTAKAPH